MSIFESSIFECLLVISSEAGPGVLLSSPMRFQGSLIFAGGCAWTYARSTAHTLPPSVCCEQRTMGAILKMYLRRELRSGFCWRGCKNWMFVGGFVLGQCSIVTQRRGLEETHLEAAAHATAEEAASTLLRTLTIVFNSVVFPYSLSHLATSPTCSVLCGTFLPKLLFHENESWSVSPCTLLLRPA